MSDAPPGVLIQCVGNRLRRDDGVGPAVAACLKRRRLAAGARVVELWGEGSELMDQWAPGSRVILVDAARSGAPPGTVHRFDALTQALPRNIGVHTTHRFGALEAVEMARVLGRLPATLQLYLVEGSDFGPGDGLSPAVERVLYLVVSSVVDLILDIKD